MTIRGDALSTGTAGQMQAGSGFADSPKQKVHTSFRNLILSRDFPCLGAASAVRRGDYHLDFYPALGTDAAVRECIRGLHQLIECFPLPECPVAVLVAVFEGPLRIDESEFEHLLWKQLYGIRLGSPGSATSVESCPAGREIEDPGFDFDNRDFFIVGMHPGASRVSRRFEWPTLVFNALTHSEKLRNEQHYDLMTNRIRARDLRPQGTLNPNLDLLRTAQFSGRQVDRNWICPFPAALHSTNESG
jgi:uncharacterized protein